MSTLRGAESAHRDRLILVLGGSTEASELTRALSVRGEHIQVVVSFAGRTTARNPLPPGVEVRVGGFGGVGGLVDHLRQHRYDAVIDATHPFARRMPFNAAAACSQTGVALLRLTRAPWAPTAGDRWILASSIPEAADLAAEHGARRVLLTIGRQELRPFSRCAAEFVVRSIDPPDPRVLPYATVLLARAPFTVDGELGVLRTHQIDLVVAKNSGGTATRPKLDAARQLAIPVVMVERPPAPPVDTAASVEDALTWLTDHIGTR